MTTDIKFSKTQLPKIIQSLGFFRTLMTCLSNSMSDLGKTAVFDFAIPLDENHVSKMTSNVVIKATWVQ